MSIKDHYEVDDEIEVSGQTSASVNGGVSMDDSRDISGPGNLFVIQGYTGSGGYTGANYIYARDASQTLVLGSAHLTPGTLSVAQGVSIDDADVSAVVSTGDIGKMSAMQHAFVFNGSLDSVQTIGIDGSINTSQDSQMVGFLPTAFGTAGYMDVNQGPGTLDIVGEGAAVAISSLDLIGPAEVDCKLATGTGNGAWAYGNVRSASSDFGAVGAGAGAGNVDFEVDLNGNLYIDGEAEAAGIGIGAIGVGNEISGTLAASTGDGGTSVYGSNIEATNKDGIVVAAAAAGGLGVDLDLQNGVAGGGAEAALVGVVADGKNNNISAGTLAAGVGVAGTGSYGKDIEASNRDGFVVAAAAVGGLGAEADLQNETGSGGAEAALVGVAAVGDENNSISARTLAAGTGFIGTGAYGDHIEATSEDGFAVAAAAAVGLGAGADLKDGIQNATIGGGVEGAVVGVVADGKNNNISAGALAAGTGVAGTGSYGKDIEASNRDGFVVAAAAVGGLDAVANLVNGTQNATIGGGAEAALVGVAAVGDENNSISARTLATGTGFIGTGAYGDHIEATSEDGFAVAAAAAGGLGGHADLQNDTGSGGAVGAVVGVVADGENNSIRAGTLTAGTGFAGTGAYGDRIEAHNDDGFVVAAAAAGGLGASDVNLTNGLENATINGVDAEGALVGVAAVGDDRNAIRAGTLETETGFAGTGAYGDRIEAHNDEGFVVAAAASGCLGGDVTLQNRLDNATISGGGEVALFCAEANGTGNNLRVGGVWTATGNSAEVVAVDVEASSLNGMAVVGAAAGNLQINVTDGDFDTSSGGVVVGEGSVVGAMAGGLASYAGADILGAKSEGNITFAGGKNLTASVQSGGALAGAISGTCYNSDNRWASSSVEVNVLGSGNISGNFRADTISNVTTAKANNVSAQGAFVNLKSRAENVPCTITSEVNTTIASGRFDGVMEASYAGNGYTMASQNGSISSLGGFVVIATAKNSSALPKYLIDSQVGGVGYYDIDANAWTDDIGQHATTTLVVI